MKSSNRLWTQPLLANMLDVLADLPTHPLLARMCESFTGTSKQGHSYHATSVRFLLTDEGRRRIQRPLVGFSLPLPVPLFLLNVREKSLRHQNDDEDDEDVCASPQRFVSLDDHSRNAAHASRPKHTTRTSPHTC